MTSCILPALLAEIIESLKNEFSGDALRPDSSRRETAFVSPRATMEVKRGGVCLFHVVYLRHADARGAVVSRRAFTHCDRDRLATIGRHFRAQVFARRVEGRYANSAKTQGSSHSCVLCVEGYTTGTDLVRGRCERRLSGNRRQDRLKRDAPRTRPRVLRFRLSRYGGQHASGGRRAGAYPRFPLPDASLISLTVISKNP